MAEAHRSLFCGHGTDGKQAGPSDACSEVTSDLREMALTLAGTLLELDCNAKYNS